MAGSPHRSQPGPVAFWSRLKHRSQSEPRVCCDVRTDQSGICDEHTLSPPPRGRRFCGGLAGCRFLSGERGEPLPVLLPLSLFVQFCARGQQAPPLFTKPSTLSCFDWSAAGRDLPPLPARASTFWGQTSLNRYSASWRPSCGCGLMIRYTQVGVACWSDTPQVGVACRSDTPQVGVV